MVGASVPNASSMALLHTAVSIVRMASWIGIYYNVSTCIVHSGGPLK